MPVPADDVPEWELTFRFTCGRLCLSFCATVGERWRRSFERLRTPGDYGRWVVAAGLLKTAPPVSDDHLRQARHLREAIYRTVRAAMDELPPRPADLAMINAWSARPDPAPQLINDWSSRTHALRPVAATLSAIARDTVDLLSGPERHRVRECAAADCALLFVDRSRPGRRRWCADNACGNRYRAAAYRRRHTTPGARTARAPATSPNAGPQR
jgi:predicted RNA-binding Zn ribbon-like protein